MCHSLMVGIAGTGYVGGASLRHAGIVTPRSDSFAGTDLISVAGTVFVVILIDLLVLLVLDAEKDHKKDVTMDGTYIFQGKVSGSAFTLSGCTAALPQLQVTLYSIPWSLPARGQPCCHAIPRNSGYSHSEARCEL